MSTTEFNYLVLQSSELLKPFAISLTKDCEMAKDLCQETLYKAIANRDKYNIGTNIKAWLYTIMRNIYINDYRRKVKRNFVSNDFSEEFRTYNHSGHAENNAAVNIVIKEIRKKIHELPEIFNRPFILYFEGYKYHEIAFAMNEPLGTIKSRIHFARKLLKEQIQKELNHV